VQGRTGAAKHKDVRERPILTTRFKRCAQVIARDGMYASFAGAKTGHGHPAFGGRLALRLIGHCCRAGKENFLVRDKRV